MNKHLQQKASSGYVLSQGYLQDGKAGCADSGVWVTNRVYVQYLASAVVGVDVEPRREEPLISEKLSVYPPG
jgi:hypothetical protein